MRYAPLRADDAGRRLDRALIADARAAGVEAEVADRRVRPWASATFIGAQHAVTLVADRAPALGRWIADLPEAELTVRGHLVADCAVDAIEDDETSVRIALTVLVIES